MNGAQIREIGPAIELPSRLTVDRRHATVVEYDQIAAAQTGKPDGWVALGGQITVRRQAE
jgi:hypothetical protein